MVPGFYVELDAIPLTPNGKIDRKGLPDVSGDDLIRKEYVAPRNAIEWQLAVIWQDVLGVDKIGITDNFFELGGHSLKVARLYELIRKNISQDIKITDLFSMTSINLQAEYLSRDTLISSNQAEINEIDF
jgi:hypothetical protein